VKVDWRGWEADTPTRKKVSLPTYAFQRQRYWVLNSDEVEQGADRQPEAAKAAELKQAGPVRKSGILDRLSDEQLPNRKDLMIRFLRREVSQTLGIEEAGIDSKKGLMAMGMESLLSISFRNRLNSAFDLPLDSGLPSTLTFDYPTIEVLAEFLLTRFFSDKNARPRPKRNLRPQNNEPIAIVGMSCRFPGGANDLESFWDLLAKGGDGIVEIPPDRWNVGQLYDPNPVALPKPQFLASNICGD